MPREAINVPRGVRGPISPAVRAGDFIFVGGQIGFKDPNTGREIEDLEGQIHQVFARTKKVLAAAGASLNDVVKVTVYLRNGEDYARMNEVYSKYFPKDPPARKTVVVPQSAVPQALIEMECIAYCPSES